MTTLEQLAADLATAGERTTRIGRGTLAPVLNDAAARSRTSAASKWSKYGRGAEGSAGTIRARMYADKSILGGMVMADGQGAFQSEHGTSQRAPDPVISVEVEQSAEAAAAAIGDAAEQALE